MNRQEAKHVRAAVRMHPRCQVSGIRRYGRRSYSIDVTDTISGYSFVVHSLADWEERVKDWQTEQELHY